LAVQELSQVERPHDVIANITRGAGGVFFQPEARLDMIYADIPAQTAEDPVRHVPKAVITPRSNS
ncbi:MAG: hypothetical protein JWR59_289, partial [Brevundimonas sp.]|nr:hypothetical protein [Brevundimonas sp.]